MSEINLGTIRNEIDSIDKELLSLFLKRMKCSENVAKYKIENNLPVLNKQREEEILESIRIQSKEFGNYASTVFSAIMSVSKYRQLELMDVKDETFEDMMKKSKNTLPEKYKIICQGTDGAYSHIAAKTLFNDSDVEFKESFEDVFKAVSMDENSFGVIPVENSAAGSVNEVYDLIMKYRFYIVSAIKLGVNHCLAAKKGSEINKIISHPQALMQCGKFIKENDFIKEEFSNTAAAAKFVSESENFNIAAICSKSAAEKYSLDIISENIQDDKSNHTRFAVISKNPIFMENADKISLCFSLPNETGSLYKILERFSVFDLNLSKIESRPIKGRNFEYDFYVDFEGKIKNKKVSMLLSQMKHEFHSFSFLGNYKEF